MLSAGTAECGAVRTAAPRSRGPSARWRAPVSIGLGLPLLLGSTPAAAAGTSGLALGGLTTGLGLLAALWALLAPGGAEAFASPTAIATVVALGLGAAAWRWRPARASGRRTSALMRARALPMSETATPALEGAAVLEAARARFMSLQAAWDAGDVPALRRLTTPEMLAQLLPVLPSRGTSRTDVISLHAELLGLEELGASWLASVEFSGLIRESAEQGAVPFRELWMLACEKGDTPSWRLVRQQALF